MSKEESSIFKETHHDKVSVDWTIRKFFPFRYESDDSIGSPDFSLSCLQLNLFLYPNGEIDEDSNGFVGLYISINSYPSTDITFTYTVGIRNRDGSIYKSYSSEFHYADDLYHVQGTPKLLDASELQKSKDGVSPDGTSLTLFCTAQVKDSSYVETASQTSPLENTYRHEGTPKLLEASELQKYKDRISPDGATLSLFCTARVEDSSFVEAACQTSPPESVDTLLRNFQDLLLSGSQSDATVKLKDREIPVHRSILAARSSVFHSMFEHDMLEKNDGVINIEEFEHGDFHDFLLFLYAGKKDHVTPANAPALYKISHKYELKDLREVCMLCMRDKISVESFCDIILLASVYDESDLLKIATDFFVKNTREIVRHPTWSSFLVAHPPLANELFVKLTE